ncbi:MAG: FHA domain-containing protein [Verrucomicrobia subdivision 3 bacterium]|nr:FHA domain-containing protein [Limisphaerales bacterium]
MSFEIEITYDGEVRTLENSKPELTVGRSTPAAEVDVDLSPDKSVSRKHFLIKLEYNMSNAKNEAWIVDLGSSRGTTVNDERVTDPVKITRADVVKAGDSELQVKIKQAPKEKSKMSFQEKVAARSGAFGETAPKPLPSNPSKLSKPKDRPTKIATRSDEEIPPPPPAEEPVLTSVDETAPGLMAALTSGAHQTECAGFVAYSIEDLATAANRYARENKMHAISASVVQEGKGSSACFRALVVFQNPNCD